MQLRIYLGLRCSILVINKHYKFIQKEGPSFVHYIYALFSKKYTQKMHLMHLEAEMKTEENLVQNEKKEYNTTMPHCVS